VRLVGGLVAVLFAVVLGLFGVILILYRGDAGAEQDIDIGFWDAGTVDADIVGVVLVIAAAALTLISIRLFRRP
jgi:drug/metabolite transporter (DMT)-like permease